MYEIKKIRAEGVPRALAKADRYRVIGDPRQAVSICHDILEIQPRHQQALRTVVLAMTDLYGRPSAPTLEATQAFAQRLEDGYQRAYCLGVIDERMARSVLKRHVPNGNYTAYDLLERALGHFAEAERLSAPDDDDAILRWNSCVRTIEERKLTKYVPDDWEPQLLE